MAFTQEVLRNADVELVVLCKVSLKSIPILSL